MSGSLVRDPVQPDLIASELGSDTFVRAFRGVEIHVTTGCLDLCENIVYSLGVECLILLSRALPPIVV